MTNEFDTTGEHELEVTARWTAPASDENMVKVLPPRRELDALVAEKVMGWRRVNIGPDYNGEHDGCEVLLSPTMMLSEVAPYLPRTGPVPLWYFVPDYSTVLGATWQVVVQMERNDFWAKLTRKSEYYKTRSDRPLWRVEFRCVRGATRGEHSGTAEEIEHAICLAALAAVAEDDAG